MLSRLVTVFCDASFTSKDQCGFAVWAKTDGKTLRWAQEFKTEILDSSQAEFAAAANAVFLVVKHFELIKGDKIILQSDNSEVVGSLNLKVFPILKMKKDVVSYIKSVPTTVICRHVKAHLPSNTGPRHAVNNWVDQAANSVRKKKS